MRVFENNRERNSKLYKLLQSAHILLSNKVRHLGKTTYCKQFFLFSRTFLKYVWALVFSEQCFINNHFVFHPTEKKSLSDFFSSRDWNFKFEYASFYIDLYKE